MKTPAPRTPLWVEVSYRKNYARDASYGTLKNISLTGAFLANAKEPLGIGEKLNLTFSVSGREREIPAITVWSNQHGTGVKFLPQNNRDTQIIDDLIFYVESKRSDTREILEQIFKKVA